MDSDIARWVLEFILREPVDDEVVKAMVRFVPLSNQPSSLTKTMLLRRIESEIANGWVSPKVLELLEYIEESDYCDGIAASELMKVAYCAVAVDCTVRFLEEREDKEAKYFEAVKIIWRGSVSKMEKSEKCGLVSDELRSWKDDIERGVLDASIWGNLLRKNRENDAVEAVSNYVAEEWKLIGPSFLVLVRETLDDDAWEEIMGPDDVPFRDQIGASIEDFLDLIQSCAGLIGGKEVAKSNGLPRRKHVANKRSRGVKIVDTEDVDVGTSCNKYECPPTIEVDKVREALKSSSLELQAVVRDPLPDAMQFAETIASAIERVNISHGPSMENQNRVDADAVNPATENGAEAVQDNENNLETQCPSHQNKVPKLGIMDRNSTARTYEWNDSIDALPEESPSCHSRLKLPSPKGGRLVSPLKKYETAKLGKRRKKKKWSQVEEDTLRTGVQKYGKGNWKLILNSYRDIFEERTDGDLKDKWRNMTRT